jgi:hypothetical protein
MPYVTGFLRIRRGGHPDQGLPGGEGSVDPDYGIGIEHPDQGLPGAPPYPDQGLPMPPPGVWPPLTPSHPIQPAPPDVPPGTIWPPVFPPRPSQGLPPVPGRPDQGLPPQPGHPDQGLPGPEVYWVVAGIPGVGWRYICVDPTLRPDQGLPPVPGRPDQGLPPAAQPKG